MKKESFAAFIISAACTREVVCGIIGTFILMACAAL